MKIDLNDALNDMDMDLNEEEKVTKKLKESSNEVKKDEKVDFNNDDFETEPQKIEKVADIDKSEIPAQRKRPTRKKVDKTEKVITTAEEAGLKTEVKKEKTRFIPEPSPGMSVGYQEEYDGFVEGVVEETSENVENTIKEIKEEVKINTKTVEEVKETTENVENVVKVEKKKPLTFKEKREQLKATMEHIEKETSDKAYVKDENSYKKEIEQKKFNIVPLIIGIVVIIIIVIIAVFVIKNATKDNNKHITTIDLNEELAKVNQQYEDSYKAKEEANHLEEITLAEAKENGVAENIYKKNEDFQINYSVNTKLENDTEYKDYETYLNVSFDNIYQGYDNVISYITEYNKASDTVVEIGNKNDFYTNYYGNEIVLFEFNVEYDENIASASGKIYNIPTMDVEIISTAEDDNAGKIVVGEYAFNTPSVIPLTVVPTEINVGDTVTYRFVAILPSNASADSYNLGVKMNSIDFKEEKSFKVEGQKINDLGIDYEQLNITEVTEESNKNASVEESSTDESTENTSEEEPVG